MILAICVWPAVAQDTAPTPVSNTDNNPPTPVVNATAPAVSPKLPQALDAQQVIDQIVFREHELVKNLRNYSPLVETYIQNMTPDKEMGFAAKGDTYFIGKLDLSRGVQDVSFLPQPGIGKRALSTFTHFFSVDYISGGFAQMILVDADGFDLGHYDFHYVRREFLGEVRAMVFDVTPKKGAGIGRFMGRIWVEDQDYNIVRFNGVYEPPPSFHHYFHFDSWRIDMGPGLWLPAYVYSEETDFKFMMRRTLRFKSQTRIWGYDLKHAGRQEEMTTMLIDAPTIKDQPEAAQESTPVTALRAWEREAEDNVIERLEKAGLMAPDGEVNKVLETVINNLEVTNNLDIQPEVRARVLLTSPLESFTIGHTIVLSRGLIDVLPDEASLAAMLAHELAHIQLGHRLDTKYAFNDRMLFADEATYRKFGFRWSDNYEAEANQKAVEFLKNSPYKDKLGNAGLFLRELSMRAHDFPGLIRPHLGNRLVQNNGQLLKMADLMSGAPELQPKKIDQIAALPLGGRVRVDPWSSQVLLTKARPVALLSSREKLPLEVTPFMPYLTRQSSTPGAVPTKTAEQIVPSQDGGAGAPAATLAEKATPGNTHTPK